MLWREAACASGGCVHAACVLALGAVQGMQPCTRQPRTFSSTLPSSCVSLLVVSASLVDPARLSRLSDVPCFIASA
jgi:hypothetical protein